jgi:hypothetical protein
MCIGDLGKAVSTIFQPHKWFRSSKAPPMPTIEIPKSRAVAPLPRLEPVSRVQRKDPQDISRFSSGITPTVAQILGLQVPPGIGLMTPGSGGNSRG